MIVLISNGWLGRLAVSLQLWPQASWPAGTCPLPSFLACSVAQARLCFQGSWPLLVCAAQAMTPAHLAPCSQNASPPHPFLGGDAVAWPYHCQHRAVLLLSLAQLGRHVFIPHILEALPWRHFPPPS